MWQKKSIDTVHIITSDAKDENKSLYYPVANQIWCVIHYQLSTESAKPGFISAKQMIIYVYIHLTPLKAKNNNNSPPRETAVFYLPKSWNPLHQ